MAGKIWWVRSAASGRWDGLARVEEERDKNKKGEAKDRGDGLVKVEERGKKKKEKKERGWASTEEMGRLEEGTKKKERKEMVKTEEWPRRKKYDGFT